VITVEAYLQWKQPWEMKILNILWEPEELNEEQKKLDRLMRLKPGWEARR
jgi:hypothetical protein